MSERDIKRTRTIEWADPEAIMNATRELGGGLAFLEAWRDGRVPQPPICDLMNFRLSEAEAGRVAMTCTPEEYHYNPGAIVHGGLAATLIDSATGIAVVSVLPPGTLWTTLNLNVTFTRPMTRDTGPVRCEGRVVHQGRRVVTAEADVTSEDGKLIAHGSASCLVLET
jgi:uncharacterized protein (TIGR00369 family)